jgi:hypothetical protein
MKRLVIGAAGTAVLWTLFGLGLSAQQPQRTPWDIVLELEQRVSELKTLVTPPPPPPPPPPEACGDGIDNDQDGQIDEGCATLVATGPELTAALLKGGRIAVTKPLSGNFTVTVDGTTLEGLTSLTGRASVPDPATPGGELPAPELAAYTITASDPYKAVLTILANDVTVRGLTFTGVKPDRTGVVLGRMSATSVDQQPQRVTLDQNAILGTNGLGHRGVEVHAREFRLTRNHIAGWLEQGRQSQGVWISNTPGPGLIEDNYIAGSGENILSGGDDPDIPGVVPSDIVVRKNLLHKPAAWRTKSGSVANLFEIKNGRRWTVEDNVMDGNWTDIQAGHSIVLTVRNQYGGCPWCVVDEITVSRNVLVNAYASGSSAVNILGNDNNHPSAQTQRITITGNHFVDAKSGVMVQRGVCQMLTVTTNTAERISGKFLYYVGRDATTGLPLGCVTPTTITGNVFDSGAYGIFGEGPVQPGTTTLDYWTGKAYTMTGNVIEKSADRAIPYPAGQLLLVAPGTLLSLLDVDGHLLSGGAGW